MITFPNAKINIGLNITEKRADGFHNIESCFYPIGLSDCLEIIPAKKTTFSASGIQIPDDDGTNNLTLKAYELLRKDYDLPPIEIHLLKGIPIGAGLGGGSADAAFCLTLLNHLFSLQLSSEMLQNYARQLGSDCAFFIDNTPTFCFGKGDKFSPLNIDLKGKGFVLVNPNIHISTQEAYSGVMPKKPAIQLKELLQQPMEMWKDSVKNDFEDSIFPKYPSIEAIKNKLYDLGAIYASMSGSGSTLYGIFEKPISLKSNFDSYFVYEGELK